MTEGVIGMRPGRFWVWICALAMVAGIAGTVALLSWPLTATVVLRLIGTIDDPSSWLTRDIACGNALDSESEFRFVNPTDRHGLAWMPETAITDRSSPQCVDARVRNRWGAVGVVAAVAAVAVVLMVAVRAMRRHGTRTTA
jgi:hypothetical protein